MSTGLFLVRRDSTCITRRISSSRPITGSSLPRWASSGEIAAVALERLIGALGVLTRHALRASDACQRFEDLVARDAVPLEKLGGRGAARLRRDGHEQMLGADVFVFQTLSFGLREIGHQVQTGRQTWLSAAVGLRELRQELTCTTTDRRGIGRHLPEQFGNDALTLFHECDEQVFGLDLRMIHLLGQVLGAEHGFLSFFRELIDVHHATVCFALADSLRSASKCSRCSGVTCFGSSTSTVA